MDEKVLYRDAYRASLKWDVVNNFNVYLPEF